MPVPLACFGRNIAWGSSARIRPWGLVPVNGFRSDNDSGRGDCLLTVLPPGAPAPSCRPKPGVLARAQSVELQVMDMGPFGPLLYQTIFKRPLNLASSTLGSSSLFMLNAPEATQPMFVRAYVLACQHLSRTASSPGASRQGRHANATLVSVLTTTLSGSSQWYALPDAREME